MQKLSETVYASLFWLISGLLVWLVIVPIALICSPVVLVIATGKVLLKMFLPNLAKADRESPTNPESQPANAGRSLLTALLLITLVEVPALVAAVISLQPTRVLKGEQVHAQKLQPQPAKAQEQSSTDTIEVPAEE